MSATPEMKWERINGVTNIVLNGDKVIVRITGPSREAVARKILSMEQVVGALKGMVEIGCEFYDMECGESGAPAVADAHLALAAWEGKT